MAIKEANPRVSVRYLAVAMVALLLASMFSMFMPSARAEINPPVMISPGYWETAGTWVIQAGDNVVHGNKTIYVNGDLIIEGQGALTLFNVTLQINSSVPGEFYIEVQPGGVFHVYDGGDGLTPFDAGDSDPSTIQPIGPVLPYRFYIRTDADFLLNRSRILFCGLPVVGDPTYGDDHGVYSESDFTVIEDSLLDMNTIGLVANHSRARVWRTGIFNSQYGVVGAENALLEFDLVDVIWSSYEGIFLNGSRMYYNDSWIARNGFGPGVVGVNIIRGSTLVMDNCFILQNAGGGAFSMDSTMTVTNSQVVDNFGAGLYWSASPGIDVVATATDNWIEMHSRAMEVNPWQGNAHVEFWRNNITDYNEGTTIGGLDVTGNYVGNTLWNGILGLVIDAESVGMDISSNSFDGHDLSAIEVYANVSAILKIERNRINNTFTSGYSGMYLEPMQFIDARIANNTITNVTGAGIAIHSPMNAYVVAWVYSNTLLNVSADCMNICGAIHLYSFSGDLDVVVYENLMDWIGDAGIYVWADGGSIVADIGFNDVLNIGVMPGMFPASIVALANSGIVDADIVNNTLINNFAWWGIMSAGFLGANTNITGNTIVNMGDWGIYFGAGPYPVVADVSYNIIDTVFGGIYGFNGMEDGNVSLYGNQIHAYVFSGIALDQFSNLTLDARYNDVGTGDSFALAVNIFGNLESVLDGNFLGGSIFEHSVYVMVQGQANLTMLYNDMVNAALDGFHLEASSANLVMEWNDFANSRVNFNVTTWDPFGHLMIDSYFDFFTYSAGSYPLMVHAEGTSDIQMDYVYALFNTEEVRFELNQSAVVRTRAMWIDSNTDYGWQILHNFGTLDLTITSSSFLRNNGGLYVQSGDNATITVSNSYFNENTVGYGLNLFAMTDLTLRVTNTQINGNGQSGLYAWAFGTLSYSGNSNSFALNQWDGLYMGSWGAGVVDITSSDFMANCKGLVGCSGMTFDFALGLGASVVLDDIEVIGNDMYGIRLFGADARISNAVIHGHDYGIISGVSNAIVESSELDMNNNSLSLVNDAHFIVFNSTLSSISFVDFILDWNSTLWCINSTVYINNGMYLDSLSWAKRSWYVDFEVQTNTGVPLAGALVNATDAFGTVYVNDTTGPDGTLRLNIIDERWFNTSTSVNYNSYWLSADAPGVGSTAWSYFFNTYSYIVMVIDDVDGPIANAGPDQIVDEDTVVQFDGSASMDNVMIQWYTWTFMDQGVPQMLNGPTPTYTFNEPGIYVVTLEVSDGWNPTSIDTVQITVLDVTPPTADAGPDQNVPSPTTVFFDGSGSADNVAVVNYTWTFTYNGTPITLYGVNPSFTFWTIGDYTVTLNIRDNASNGAADNLMVTVFDATNPIADAGPDQIVDEDTVVTFNGSGSSDNVGVVSYMWTFAEGSNIVTLMGISPTYVFKDPGNYVVTLTVRDAAGLADQDTVTVTVLDATPPTVLFTSPYDGATDQPLSTSVVIGFSEPMDTLSVESSITISSGATITAFNWNMADDTVTLMLSGLTYSSMYVVNINATATDVSGIPMTAAYFFNFITTASAGPDVNPPEVIYSYPEDSAVDIPIAVVLKVVFSEPMNTIMTEAAIQVDGAAPLSFNWLSNNTLVEVTVAPFPYSTSHTLSVSTTATDAAGNPLSAAYSATFTTEPQPAVDIIPPEVIYTNPQDGELGVPLAASVYIVFSEPMNTASVEALGVVTIDQGASIAAYVWTHGDTVMELQLMGVAQGTLYTVTVTTGAEDVAGNPMTVDFILQYTTFAPGADTTRPEIWYTFPDDGETDVYVDANLIIVFSEPMNTTSVEAAINISGVTPTGFMWTSGDTTVEVILPILSYSTSYLVNISDVAADLAGNTIFEPYLVMFQTEALPGVDTTRPYVVLAIPADGATDVSVTTSITIIFSEPMNATSVEADILVAGATITGFTWTDNDTKVEVSLQTLGYSTSYGITIGTASTDLADNQLYPWGSGFTTEAQPAVDTTPPEVVFTYPDDGDNDIPVIDGTVIIIVVFNEPMDESSVEGALDTSDGTLSGYQWSQDSKTLMVELDGVEYDTDYTLTIGSGAEDLAGNSLSQVEVDFTTMVEPEGAAPTAEFDIAQAWWLILIIIILIVVIVLLLLMRRRPGLPAEEPAEVEEPVLVEEEIPAPPEEEFPLEEPPESEEAPSDEVPVY